MFCIVSCCSALFMTSRGHERFGGHLTEGMQSQGLGQAKTECGAMTVAPNIKGNVSEDKG